MNLDLRDLPTPLARMLDTLSREDVARQPFRAVHRLVDAIEVFTKLHTVAGVSAFADAVAAHVAEAQPKESAQLRAALAAGLRTPSLGTWWSFARESARALRALGVPHPLPGADDAILNKHPLKKAFDEGETLISFRNGYAHGATPSDDDCRADYRRTAPRLFDLIERASWLRATRWRYRDAQGAWHIAHGVDPTPASPDEAAALTDAPAGTLFLLTASGPLALDPLLSARDGEMWFYNDLRDRHATLLNYPLAAHRKEPDARDALLARYPIDQWRRLQGADIDPFRERIEALTEVFRGRTAEITQVFQALQRKRGFQVVWGPPGVGKSALLARVLQLCRWDAGLRRDAAPGVPWETLPLADPERPAPAEAKAEPPIERLHTLEFFIRRGTNATASQLFDSLNQRIDAVFGTRQPLGSTDVERRNQLDARLRELSARFEAREGRERLLLVLDGLDEAENTDDPLLSLLPRESRPYIHVLYGARPTQFLKHTFYDELDREHRAEFHLTGLGVADTRALMYGTIDKYRIEPGWIAAVMQRSEGNPLYLRLLCQGLADGSYRLGDEVGLPKDMDTLYTNALVHMTKRCPDAPRLLTLLAAARDFVSPAMAAELMGCDVAALHAGALSTARELLFENPRTAHVEDYQLFHESLREHLHARYGDDVRAWRAALTTWCAAWKDEHGGPRHPRGERRVYAMRHAIAHLKDSAAWAKEQGRTQEEARHAQTLEALVEDRAWREACFEAVGDPAPLREGFEALQKIIRAKEATPGASVADILRLARWQHDEPRDLYEGQRHTLRTPVEPRLQAAHLERVNDLARMGARPREKVMLALMALWATATRPTALPESLVEQVGDWLEEANEPALNKLWTLGGGR